MQEKHLFGRLLSAFKDQILNATETTSFVGEKSNMKKIIVFFHTIKLIIIFCFW